MPRLPRSLQFVALVTTVGIATGTTCPTTAPLPIPQPDPLPNILDSVQFSRFEYQFLQTEEQQGNCHARSGTIQHAVITKSAEGLVLELTVITSNAVNGEPCTQDYSYFDTCNYIHDETPRLLSDAEIASAAAVIDAMKTREEAGDGPVNGVCVVPCYRRIYVRDDSTYQTLLPCNNGVHDNLSLTSIAAIDQLLTQLWKNGRDENDER